ncbi:restriction endonuclease [Luteibacter yeojuensis]|uniref:restriction endonuclease n=1 Tax=Luteibacter yeojuensis TaxID=345309 RepID=UPI000695FA95|nr:restriction endonuclease [Luteibacter yeojuensis]
MAFSARLPEAGDALARLAWQDFEHLLAEHYRGQGYRVELVSAHDLKALGNAGLDMRIRRGGDTGIVQCGHWDALFVDVAEVQQLMSAMINEAAGRGVLVTRGSFTQAARKAVARQPRIQLVDGEVLRAMLKLPDHLDTSLPGTRPAEKVARTAAAAKRRARRDGRPRLVPALMGGMIALLLGFFVWRAFVDHDDEAPAATASAPFAQAPATGTTAAMPPQAASVAVLPPPAEGPTAPATTPVAPEVTAVPPAAHADEVSPSLARELAARAQARRDDEAATSRKKADDALKVMERNTREVGSY